MPREPTLTLPSNPVETTVLLRLSTCIPVTAFVCRPRPFAHVLCPLSGAWLASSSCLRFAWLGVSFGGYRCLCIPDCKLYMSIPPNLEPTNAKVPQGEIATLY